MSGPSMMPLCHDSSAPLRISKAGPVKEKRFGARGADQIPVAVPILLPSFFQIRYATPVCGLVKMSGSILPPAPLMQVMGFGFVSVYGPNGAEAVASPMH